MEKISLKALRVNKNISLKKASKSLGITPKTLIKYENGQSVPNFMMVKKMCEVYECAVDTIDTKNFEPYITE